MVLGIIGIILIVVIGIFCCFDLVPDDYMEEENERNEQKINK